jgi:hypothetical protein
MTSTPLYTPRDLGNYSQFVRWMMGAVAAFAVATILIDGNWIPRAAGWALAVLTLALMLQTVRVYMRFLRTADELLRKVHLESLALAFGTGAVVTMVYRLCERLGAPQLDINDPMLVMMLVWIGSQFVAQRRYAVEDEQ